MLTTLQVQQLVRAQPEDFHDLRVETAERPTGECFDDSVQCRSPALDARRNFCGKRTIPIVVEGGARTRDGGRQVASAGRDGKENVVGGDSRRRNHRTAEKREPAGMAWPARKSRARIGFLPSA